MEEKYSAIAVVMALLVCLIFLLRLVTSGGETKEEREARFQKLEREGLVTKVILSFDDVRKAPEVVTDEVTPGWTDVAGALWNLTKDSNDLDATCGWFSDPQISVTLFSQYFHRSECKHGVMTFEPVLVVLGELGVRVENDDNHRSCAARVTISREDILGLSEGREITAPICKGITVTIRK
jgi:hypothetical protein